MALAAVKSYARQKAGHHTGTPGFVTMDPWNTSNTACPANAAATIHNFRLKPRTATAAKAVITADSTSTAWKDPLMTANST